MSTAGPGALRNATFANVPELFNKAFHWSSTQYSRFLAFVQDFDSESG